MQGNDIWRRVKRVGAALALAALAFKAGIPAGYMLTADAQGVAVTICTSVGEYEAVLDLETGQIKPGDHDVAPGASAHDQPCPFSIAAAPAPAPDGAALAAPLRVEFHAAFAPLALRPRIAPTGPPMPARGPPLHA